MTRRPDGGIPSQPDGGTPPQHAVLSRRNLLIGGAFALAAVAVPKMFEEQAPPTTLE